MNNRVTCPKLPLQAVVPEEPGQDLSSLLLNGLQDVGVGSQEPPAQSRRRSWCRRARNFRARRVSSGARVDDPDAGSNHDVEREWIADRRQAREIVELRHSRSVKDLPDAFPALDSSIPTALVAWLESASQRSEASSSIGPMPVAFLGDSDDGRRDAGTVA